MSEDRSKAHALIPGVRREPAMMAGSRHSRRRGKRSAAAIGGRAGASS